MVCTRQPGGSDLDRSFCPECGHNYDFHFRLPACLACMILEAICDDKIREALRSAND